MVTRDMDGVNVIGKLHPNALRKEYANGPNATWRGSGDWEVKSKLYLANRKSEWPGWS